MSPLLYHVVHLTVRATYTIYNNIKWTNSLILQLILHMRRFYTATYSEEVVMFLCQFQVRLLEVPDKDPQTQLKAAQL